MDEGDLRVTNQAAGPLPITGQAVPEGVGFEPFSASAHLRAAEPRMAGAHGMTMGMKAKVLGHILSLF